MTFTMASSLATQISIGNAMACFSIYEAKASGWYRVCVRRAMYFGMAITANGNQI